jgi:hypothetical protein
VHSAQGGSCDVTHAVLGERANRNLLYVAMSRGRESNQAYLYERLGGEGEHEHAEPAPGVHVLRRSTSRQAARLVRTIIGRDEQAHTAHDVAANTDRHQLPDRVASLLVRRENAVRNRRHAYQLQQDIDGQQDTDRHRSRSRIRSRSRSRSRSRDDGYDLSL